MIELLPLSTGVLDEDLGSNCTIKEARYRKAWRFIRIFMAGTAHE